LILRRNNPEFLIVTVLTIILRKQVVQESGTSFEKESYMQCSACLLFLVPSLVTKANVQYGCGRHHLPATIITIIITVAVFITISSMAK
jgi:hypothetical protein